MELNNLSLKELEGLFESISNYQTLPVSINTFLDDSHYLGDYFGEKKIQPYWREFLNKVYANPITNDYWLVFLRGCFAGDTKISLLNGEHKQIEDIAKDFNDTGKPQWILSYNIHRKCYEPDRIINAYCSGEDDVYEILLDNNEKIECTKSHKFLSRDKKWVSIDNSLNVGTSLFPYRYDERQGYHNFYDADSNRWKSRYKVVGKWKTHKPRGFHIHHKDFNKSNDSPENLCTIKKRTHIKYHSKVGGRVLKKWREKIGKDKFKEIMKERSKNGARLLHHSPLYESSRKIRNEKLRTHMKESGQAKKMSSKLKVKYNYVNGTARHNLIEYNKSEKGRNESVKRAAHMRFLYSQKSPEEKKVIDSKKGLGGLKRRYGIDSIEYQKALNKVRELDPLYNHAVVSIRKIGVKKIYDLTTEKNHNFILSAGVIAHNSIGQGKSTIACVGICYDLHRLLCLLSPQKSFHLLQDTTILFAIFSVTLSLSQDVVWGVLSSMLARSPYFQSLLLKMPKSLRATPMFPKNIGIFLGSRLSHALGKAVYSCLTGDTTVTTTSGDVYLEDLVISPNAYRLISFDTERRIQALGNITNTMFTGKKEVFSLFLSNGRTINATADHKFLTTDLIYKSLEDLKPHDNLIPYLPLESSKLVSSDYSVFVISKTYKSILPTFDIQVEPHHNFVTNGIYAHNCILDEANFEILHDQVYKSFLSVLRRMESRFSPNSTVPTGKVWLVSSEAAKTSTLNRIITSYSGKLGVFGSQKALWDVFPERYSGEVFKVFVGTDTRPPEILLPDSHLITDYPELVISVPVEHKDSFDADIYSSLNDLAGISTTSGSKVFRIKERVSKALILPQFFPDNIILDFDNDSDQLQSYCSMPLNFSSSPRCIHLDIALSGDRFGIASSYIADFMVKEIPDPISLIPIRETRPKVMVDFAFTISPPPGKQIPIFKVRSFIDWLASLGYPIFKITADGFQSSDILQYFKKKGYKVAVVSTDKTTDAYSALRSKIYEEDLYAPNSPLLKKELFGLEFVQDGKKIDHPAIFDDGTVGSKDLADGVGGSVFSLLSHADDLKALVNLKDLSYKIESQEEEVESNLLYQLWPQLKDRD